MVSWKDLAVGKGRCLLVKGGAFEASCLLSNTMLAVKERDMRGASSSNDLKKHLLQIIRRTVTSILLVQFLHVHFLLPGTWKERAIVEREAAGNKPDCQMLDPAT